MIESGLDDHLLDNSSAFPVHEALDPLARSSSTGESPIIRALSLNLPSNGSLRVVGGRHEYSRVPSSPTYFSDAAPCASSTLVFPLNPLTGTADRFRGTIFERSRVGGLRCVFGLG